jgi:hypothetical protein
VWHNAVVLSKLINPAKKRDSAFIIIFPLGKVVTTDYLSILPSDEKKTFFISSYQFGGF